MSAASLTPETLRAQREAIGLTLRDLAALIPCHWTTLWRIERGQRPLTPRMAASITAALRKAQRHQ